MLEIQNCLLEFYKEFSTICDRNGITHYACGGTALGAVRHKGFIPWDDDLDFALPRNDFNKIFVDKTVELPDYYIAEIDSIALSGKLMDKRCRVRHGDEAWDGFTPYLSIDILPIDGSPNHCFMRKIHFCRVMIAFAKIKFKNLDFISDIENLKNRKSRPFIEKMIISHGRYLSLLFRNVDNAELVDKYIAISSKYDYENSKVVGIYGGRYRKKELIDKTIIGKGKMVSFEDTQIRVYEKVELYLKKIYGKDYMIVPAENCHEKHGNLTVEDNKA